jgi:hypothetical protein
MKTIIFVADKNHKETIHDYLHSELSGINTCLSGSCVCLDDHKWLDNYLHFDFTDEQLKHFNLTFAVSGIAYAQIDNKEPSIESWTKVDGTFGKTFGSELCFTSRANDNTVPHSMVFSQVPYNDRAKPNWTNRTPIGLSSIDCSNVDIIIVDSGVDTTHPDISAQVINFDWTLLKDGADGASGSQIAASLPTNYHRDPDGHGTACAGLVAGRRCGFAKNARIYSMKILGGAAESFDEITAFKLLLAFQRAKNNNKHGLVSTRPTIMSNSWGSQSNMIGMSNFKLQQRAGLAGTTIAPNPFALINYSDIDGVIAGSTTIPSAAYNAYVDLILAQGAHFLTAAGNSNHLLDYSRSYPMSAHPAFVLFQYNNGAGTIINRIAPYTVTDGATQGIDNTFTNGNSYPLMRDIGSGAAVNVLYANNGGFGWALPAGLNTTVGGSSMDPLHLTCKSPASTYGSFRSGNMSPCIIVGDVTPIGPFMTLNQAYNGPFSAANAAYCYNGLSALNTASGLTITPGCRYNSLSGAEYVKTNYSCFGPLVDVYACGNATWAPYSNQGPAGASPVNTISATERYKFFNGTSAATPVAAGCLATYLAAHPTASPTQAKRWLMNNAVSGSILETDYHTIPLRVKSLNLVTSTAGPTITMEYDCPYSILELTTNAADIINTWWNTCGQTYNVALGQGRYETLTTARKVLSLRTAHQFYRSNNLVVQAYPLRGMIVDNNTRTTYTFLSSNFANATPTDRKKTHVHSESLIV